MRNYELLANAIVIQAADDYRRALCEQHELLTKEDLDEKALRVVNAKVKEVERYFLGETIQLHTKLDGRTIMEKLRKQVVNANYDMSLLSKTYITKSPIPEEGD